PSRRTCWSSPCPGSWRRPGRPPCGACPSGPAPCRGAAAGPGLDGGRRSGVTRIHWGEHLFTPARHGPPRPKGARVTEASASPDPIRHPRLLLTAMAFAGVVTAVMQTLAVPLVPTLVDALDTTHEAVSWVVTASLIAGAVSTPVLGRLGDMYGRREVLVAALLCLAAGSLLAALSTHILLLVAGRTLQGVALAVVPLGIGILRDVLPPARVASSAALMSTTMGVGAAVGVPLTSLIARYADWHAVFWMSGGLGLLALTLVLAFVPRAQARTGGRFDAAGTLGLTVVLVCFLAAVSRGTEWGWTSPAVLGLFAVSLAVGAVWVRHETRVADPIVELSSM